MSSLNRHSRRIERVPSNTSSSSHLFDDPEWTGNNKTGRDSTRSKVLRERSKSSIRIRSTMKSVYAQLKLSKSDSDFLHIIIIVGVAGDLAQKKTFPAFWNLYKNGLLPQNLRFYGFARTPMTTDEIREKCAKFMQVPDEEQQKHDEFWKLFNYFIGSYTAKMDYEVFNKELTNFGTISNYSNRLLYIALPNTTLEHIMPYLKLIAHLPNSSVTGGVSKGWTRVMLEKPFGRDSESSEKLSQHLLSIFKEDELYRIDHFLGKEVIQNITTIRFANFLLSSTWNRNCIQAVLITTKDQKGAHFNNKYFDSYGIVRDVVQNHLLQILSLVAMEKPLSMKPNDIRDEKVKVLRCIQPIKTEDVVLGQYYGDPKAIVGDDRRNGYHDEPDIPKNSLTPTFCAAVLKVNNERWDGVPFLLKCGKAMDETSTQIRIQYKDPPGEIFDAKLERNELVIDVEPDEGVCIKAMTKLPSNSFEAKERELALGPGFKKKHKVIERLILDVLCGSQMHFIRSDEVEEASRIVTPFLEQIENEKMKPMTYINGTDGPKEATELIRRHEFFSYD